MKCHFAIVGALVLAISTPAAVFGTHAGTCGEQGEQYACGEIVVGLRDDADDTIEDVVARNGGNPDSDILERRESLTAYVVAVPTGEEQAHVDTYTAEAAVEYAELNGRGEVVPDTAVTPGPAGSDIAARAALAAMLVLVGAGVVASRGVRCESSLSHRGPNACRCPDGPSAAATAGTNSRGLRRLRIAYWRLTGHRLTSAICAQNSPAQLQKAGWECFLVPGLGVLRRSRLPS